VIGGQALNFWAEQYAHRVQELRDAAPFTSKDIDFLGDVALARQCALKLSGARVALPDPGAITPNAAKIIFHDHGGDREIDVMRDVLGVDPAEIKNLAVRIELRDQATGGPSGIFFRVMHPLHCLESRIVKIRALKIDTEHSRGQLKASVLCLREYLRTLLDLGEVREVLTLQEELFRYLTKKLHGRRIAAETGIDPFDAVLTGEPLPEAFRTKRYPQMRRKLARIRQGIKSPPP
jgi:hypothetical protein